MKRFRNVATLTAVASVFLAYQAAESPVHAAFRVPASAVASLQAASPASGAAAQDAPGAEPFTKHCAVCHGEQREGITPGFPPLLGIKRQMTDQQITDLIHKGKGRMPAFPSMPNEELTGLLRYLASTPTLTPVLTLGSANHPGPKLSGEAAAGGALFLQNCAFCHGRDAMGGETGPDLTQSKLVQSDTDGSKISGVVREGRLEKKMPAFQFSSQELVGLVAFIKARETAAAAMKGNRRGVDVSDLQTGNVEAGKKYFNEAGGCAKCHSPIGDLAGIARRYEGLRLEERMLYPRDAKSTVVVTLASGQKITGTLAYRDEFTIGLRETNGTYRSWPAEKIKYTVNSPVDAHVEQFSKYTDDDIHNLMAYLQTLR
jgi:mono/diheme cytochrome c family protein